MRPENSPSAIPPHAFVLLAALTVVSGFTWPFNKIGLNEIPPWTFRCGISLAGSAIMFVLAILARQSLAVPRNRILLLCAFAFIHTTFWNMITAFALMLMASGRAAVLAYTMPLWVAMFGIFFLNERLTLRRAVAVGLGTVGISLLFGGHGSSTVGAALMLAASVSWSVSVIMMKRIVWNIPNLSFVAWSCLIGSLPMIPFALTLEVHALKPISLEATAAAVFMVLGPTTFFNVAWFHLVRTLPAIVAAVGVLLSPVLSVLSGMVILEEAVGWREIGALVSVCAAMALVLIQPRAKDTAPAAVPSDRPENRPVAAGLPDSHQKNEGKQADAENSRR